MAQLSTTTIVQAITTGGPANDEAFQGWYYNSYSSWERIACPSTQTYSILGDYAQCCGSKDTACSTLWSSCDGNTPVGIPSTSCGVCSSMSIFQNSADLNPLTKIVCAKAWVASSIYRNIVTYSTATSVFTVSGSTTAEETSTASSTQSTTVASPASSEPSSIAATATETTTPERSSNTNNTGVIAGTVVGSVLAVALGAFALWFFYIRKRRSRGGEANTGAISPHQPYYNEILGTHSPDTKNKPPMYHHSESYEMSSNDDRTHELPADMIR